MKYLITGGAIFNQFKHSKGIICEMGKIVRNRFIPLIIKRLKTINPYKVILFGSYANGNPTKDSDIDLIVVTNDDILPKSFKEKSEIYLSVCKNIRDIREKVPIDLIVYTKSELKKFIEAKSIFSKEILSNSKELL